MKFSRREFLQSAALATASTGIASDAAFGDKASTRKPNLVFVFADQWRLQSTGYMGDSDVRTPLLDQLAADSINFTHAVAGCSVCCPYRASLITGQYPLRHGLFLNDLRLSTRAVSIAEAYKQAGYDTAYIGKWHLDGGGRNAYIPPERRQGFDYWKALECTHNYNQSEYFAGDSDERLVWPGYDAYAQTDDAVAYLNAEERRDAPFALFLSWGPPHDPYRTGPEDLLAEYDALSPTLRPNVPTEMREEATRNIAGYYAHIAALDRCIGQMRDALRDSGLERNTILVITSDHGDMLYSQGEVKKQKPWDESIRVPFLLRCPTDWNIAPRECDALINTPDIMPTLLGLCGIEIPPTVEGGDYSRVALGQEEAREEAALILCPAPFGEWARVRGGREYRGVRTHRYTYARTLDGPWLLYDNVEDPYQLRNRCDDPDMRQTQERLEELLRDWLQRTDDDFAHGDELIARCGYTVNENGTVGYQNPDHHGQVASPATLG